MRDEADYCTLCPHRDGSLDSVCTRDLHPWDRGLAPFPRWASYGRYGFFDSFNPASVTPMSALCQAVLIRLGWVDNDYLSDDQGPILGYARKLQNGDRLERHSQSFNLVRGM
jgi:hypothetical protein